MGRKVTLIRGAGAEFAPLLRRVLEAAGASLEWSEFSPAAADAGSSERGALLDSIRSTGCVLEAWAPPPGEALGLPPLARALARDLELDACAHPRKSFAGVPGAREGVDLMVWTGATEGPHAAGLQ